MTNTTGKKYGGREKGAPNRLTSEMSSILKNILYYQLNSIEDIFIELEPKDKMEAIIKLMPYVFPKI